MNNDRRNLDALPARAQQDIGQSRALLYVVLAVIQQQEQLSGCQVIRQPLGRRERDRAQAQSPSRALGQLLRGGEGARISTSIRSGPRVRKGEAAARMAESEAKPKRADKRGEAEAC